MDYGQQKAHTGKNSKKLCGMKWESPLADPPSGNLTRKKCLGSFLSRNAATYTYSQRRRRCIMEAWKGCQKVKVTDIVAL